VDAHAKPHNRIDTRRIEGTEQGQQFCTALFWHLLREEMNEENKYNEE
jgi:hypothetical protein